MPRLAALSSFEGEKFVFIITKFEMYGYQKFGLFQSQIDQSLREDVTMETQIGVMSFEDGGRGHQPWNAAGL